MTNSAEQRGWISKMRLGAVNAALMAITFALSLAASQSAQAQTFAVLHNFTGYPSDGATPYASVIIDAQGNLYGTTRSGGSFRLGTLFKLDASGHETVLHNFAGHESDGARPYRGLVRDAAENLYGTTEAGGIGVAAYGTVFKLSPNGKETILYTFTDGNDGGEPYGGLLRDKAGNLYGTAFMGGPVGNGVVFKITKTGSETVLHSFGGRPDGSRPYLTRLLMDARGNLYGVTAVGGSYGLGIVYKLSPGGEITALHNFAGGQRDGCGPAGALIMDQEGNLYGTTYSCGSANQGTIWKLSPNGDEVLLHTFASGSSDGANPFDSVIMDAEGNLYGDTKAGGNTKCAFHLGCGVIYKLTKDGKLTLLHRFDGSDGGEPIGGLIRDAKGNFYGTASTGGSKHCGTVWKLTP